MKLICAILCVSFLATSYQPIINNSANDAFEKNSKNSDNLFIIANPKLKKWFPTDDEIYMSDFIIKGNFNLEFKNGKFTELM